MFQPVLFGIHLGGDLIRSGYLRDDRLFRLDDVKVTERGRELYWFRQPNQLDYYTGRDLLGSAGNEQYDPSETVVTALRQAVKLLGRQGFVPERTAVAVPAALQEFQRRYLRCALADGFGTLRLVDVSTAALHALRDPTSEDEALLAILVAEDAALEVVIARVASGRCDILGLDSIEAFSGRALNHHLLQIVLDRLSGKARERLVAAGDHDLTGLLLRLAQSRGFLGRLTELAFPVRETGMDQAVVKLGRSDFEAFFTPRAGLLESALQRMRSEAGAAARPLDRVVLIGDLGEFGEFTTLVERLLGPVELAPISVLVDGAVLAAREPVTVADEVRSPPALVSMDQFLRSANAHPLRVEESRGAERETPSAEELATQLFSTVAQLLALKRFEEARKILADVKFRAECVLSTLSAEPPSPDAPQLNKRIDVANRDAPTGKSVRARRYLERAEQMLAAKNPIEAVKLSHEALSLDGENHDTLMALLDIHRRGAQLLSGPDNFDKAVMQLRCALDHSKRDQTTLRMLVERYRDQALFLEKSGNVCDARQLLEDAQEFADEEALADIVKELERLEGG